MARPSLSVVSGVAVAMALNDGERKGQARLRFSRSISSADQLRCGRADWADWTWMRVPECRDKHRFGSAQRCDVGVSRTVEGNCEGAMLSRKGAVV